jgi:hypothetical protein
MVPRRRRTSLVDRLVEIAGTDSDDARERLGTLIEGAAIRLALEAPPPSSTNRKLARIRRDIERLRHRLSDVPLADLAPGRGNWSHLRGLPGRIVRVDAELAVLSAQLERATLDTAHRGTEHRLADIVGACIFFFVDHSTHAPSHGETSRFSRFAHDLLASLGHEGDVTWIIRKCLADELIRKNIADARRKRRVDVIGEK